MTSRPKILITNDDGIYAPGIKHLWKALKDFADVTIVAPVQEQSAVGLSITLREPLRIQRAEWNVNEQPNLWCINGTPADCVKMGLSVVMETPPSLIVSGVNKGSNAGRNLLYSGTVAGAIEGALHDIPSIAFSCCDFFNPVYSMTEPHILTIVKHVLEHPLPQGTLLNVNFPEGDRFKGFKLTRQGKEYWKEKPDCRTHPAEGHEYYWLGCELVCFDEHEESDITWLKQGYVAAVPVYIGELTDHQHLQSHKATFEKLY